MMDFIKPVFAIVGVAGAKHAYNQHVENGKLRAANKDFKVEIANLTAQVQNLTAAKATFLRALQNQKAIQNQRAIQKNNEPEAKESALQAVGYFFTELNEKETIDLENLASLKQEARAVRKASLASAAADLKYESSLLGKVNAIENRFLKAVAKFFYALATVLTLGAFYALDSGKTPSEADVIKLDVARLLNRYPHTFKQDSKDIKNKMRQDSKALKKLIDNAKPRIEFSEKANEKFAAQFSNDDNYVVEKNTI